MRIYQAHDSKLIGMKGPFFPGEVDVLNGHLMRHAEKPALTQHLLKRLGRVAAPHYESHPEIPFTSDGYEWGWQVTTVGNNKLLIPDFGNEDTWDGRSVAVYSPTDTTNAKLAEVLEMQIDVFDAVAKRFA